MSRDTRIKFAITDRRLEEVRRLFERYRRAARERDAVLSARTPADHSVPRTGDTRAPADSGTTRSPG